MKEILVGFDGSKAATEALRWAARAAAHHGWDVLVIQSWREPVYGERSWLEVWGDPNAPEREAQADLDAATAPVAERHPGVNFSTMLVNDSPARTLVDLSVGRPLVVVGARGRGGFSTLLLGSVSQKVAATSPSTVVVVRGDGDEQGDVVVGVDGSRASRQALRWAAEEARLRGLQLRVVMAWSYLLPVGEHGLEPFRASYTGDDARAALDAIIAEELGDDPGIEVRADPVCALASRALIERGADAALVVVGPRETSVHPRAGLGSVTTQVLHHATCPVAIVRGEDQPT